MMKEPLRNDIAAKASISACEMDRLEPWRRKRRCYNGNSTTETTTTVAPNQIIKSCTRKFEDIRTVKELGADVAEKLNVPLQY